ncbi:MAG: hypothetical protein OFPII_03440 [Osedax symbiont Rs1]|nr:MAG: hypothetical protein OFPII_03440 [Osedax symbiont Rs1]
MFMHSSYLRPLHNLPKGYDNWGHTNSAISPLFALSYLRSQRYVEVSIY